MAETVWLGNRGTIRTTPAIMVCVSEKERTMVDFVPTLERDEGLLDGRITDCKPAASVAKRNAVASRPMRPE